MKNLIEFINEVLNKPFKWRWYHTAAPRRGQFTTWLADFKTQNSTFEVHLEQMEFDWGIKMHIEFADKTNKNKQEIGITGKGEAFRVFATIAEIIMDYIKKTPKLQIIEFSAAEENRKKLYKRFARMLPGFSYQGEDSTGDMVMLKNRATQGAKDYVQEYA